MEEEESKIMGLKQDFVLRRLEDQGRFLARLILERMRHTMSFRNTRPWTTGLDALYRKLLASCG